MFIAFNQFCDSIFRGNVAIQRMSLVALTFLLFSIVSPRAKASACDVLSQAALQPTAETFNSVGDGRAVSVSAEPASSAATSAAASTVDPQYELLSTDPVGPFPLSTLVPFSWTSIDGIWSMRLPDGTPMHLSLQVEADCNGRRFLKVVNFDQKSFRVQAEGTGLALANDTTIRAVMTSSSSQQMLFIRQYKVPVGKSGTRVATVVTIRPFGGSNNDDVHMIAKKASSLSLDQYIQRRKQLAGQRSSRTGR